MAVSTVLLWELALALTCPLCCSPGCSRFGGVRSRILPTPVRASRTRSQQRAMQTPSWRQPCSTAACSLWEEKRGSPCPEQNHWKQQSGLWASGRNKPVICILKLTRVSRNQSCMKYEGSFQETANCTSLLFVLLR